MKGEMNRRRGGAPSSGRIRQQACVRQAIEHWRMQHSGLHCEQGSHCSSLCSAGSRSSAGSSSAGRCSAGSSCCSCSCCCRAPLGPPSSCSSSAGWPGATATASSSSARCRLLLQGQHLSSLQLLCRGRAVEGPEDLSQRLSASSAASQHPAQQSLCSAVAHWPGMAHTGASACQGKVGCSVPARRRQCRQLHWACSQQGTAAAACSQGPH
jgi:hypothetical protein